MAFTQIHLFWFFFIFTIYFKTKSPAFCGAFLYEIFFYWFEEKTPSIPWMIPLLCIASEKTTFDLFPLLSVK